MFSRYSSGKQPGYCRHISGGHPPSLPAQLPDSFPPVTCRMPAVDPHLIRLAAAQFEPRRRPRYGNLQPCREVIIELREKGASCEAIAELLNRYGVKTSRTMVNEFVRILKQAKSTRRKKAHLPSAAPLPAPVLHPPATIAPARIETNPNGVAKPRGPHIARVELMKQGEQHD